ncbi:tryptophan--tRNA ligase, mitochondrial-like isoform X2 [Ornithodoros turicata]|uniref:tryptophan--tRNA ligase, mitochondrial-like isoform X2 n=1 Tax=Ornithodoros turicata TaxID=34597 RepID=UPI0031394088
MLYAPHNRVLRFRVTFNRRRSFPRRAFSGIQPTGVPHLGNLFGAIRQWTRLQDSGMECIFSIVDLHSITLPHYSTEELRSNIEVMTASLLACGVDPEKCILFLQSQVPEHGQLAWILCCLQTMAQLQHFPQLKEKTSGMKETPLGLYLYPVLQSADVLLYKGTDVPVGEDQLPHVYLMQDLAETFNKRFGTVFPPPKPLLVEGPAVRLRNLRDPTKKMSKSHPDPKGRIDLDDSPDQIRSKIRKALTDFTSKVTYEPEERPAVANLVALHSLLTDKTPEEICSSVQHLDTGKYKTEVAEAAVEVLVPIQRRLQEHLKDRAHLWKLLDRGSLRAREIAIRTLEEVRRASGMAPT